MTYSQSSTVDRVAYTLLFVSSHLSASVQLTTHYATADIMLEIRSDLRINVVQTCIPL